MNGMGFELKHIACQTTHPILSGKNFPSERRRAGVVNIQPQTKNIKKLFPTNKKHLPKPLKPIRLYMSS